VRVRWFTVALGALLITSCDPGNPTAPTSRPFVIRVGENIDVRDAGFSVKLVSVANDTRCPLGAPCCADCLGNAEVHVELLRDGETTPLVLNTRTAPTEGIIAAYIVRVTGLDPPRPFEGDISQSEYRVTLVVLSSGVLEQTAVRAWGSGSLP